MDDLTIGLIGANSSFAGDVYLDNLILSQKDATPNTDATQAKPEATDKTLTMTDPDASNSAKALYAYLQGLTESDQVLFGHQNDVSHSVGNNDLGDVKDVTGSVSGIFGIDSLALFGSEAGGTDAASALQSSIDYSKRRPKTVQSLPYPPICRISPTQKLKRMQMEPTISITVILMKQKIYPVIR